MFKIIALICTGLAIIIGGAGAVLYKLDKPQPVIQVAPAAYTAPVVTRPVASELFSQVNVERVKNGLPALVEDPRLDASAAAKCDEMVAMNYWAHDRPDGTEPWHLLYEQGIPHTHIAENLAYGQHTSDQVVTGWMNSPGHKANILNDYNHVGYAVCYSNNYVNTGPADLIVQHFATL